MKIENLLYARLNRAQKSGLADIMAAKDTTKESLNESLWHLCCCCYCLVVATATVVVARHSRHQTILKQFFFSLFLRFSYWSMARVSMKWGMSL